MGERKDCQWKHIREQRGFRKDEPCSICKGKVVFKKLAICPFHTKTFALFQSTQHLVTADERLYSIQAVVRADKRGQKQ